MAALVDFRSPRIGGQAVAAAREDVQSVIVVSVRVSPFALTFSHGSECDS
ncbi:Protein of unknown function [Gryllus bimaculatus]|nr:Protein of unknown function [Gryllus bimaculatus]